MVADDLLMEIDMSNEHFPHIDVPDHIENPGQYIAAAHARIAANRIKGARAKWLAESATAQRCIDFLCEDGEFAATEIRDEAGYITKRILHPIVQASVGEFYGSLYESLRDWGRLTPGQEAACLRLIDRALERRAQRDALIEAKRQTAQHIGTVGERRDFDLVIKFTTEFETQFGYTFVHVCEDAAGNVVVYKGSNQLGQKGDAIKVKATIKAHDYRDGIAQTIINRPKKI